jgi:predicted ATPase
MLSTYEKVNNERVKKSMLSKIHLKNFKKFQDVEITLRPFTILMGENSSGKTTILQAINLALYIMHDRNLITVKNGTVQAALNGTVYFLEQLPAVNISKLGELFYGGKVSNIPALIDLTDWHNNAYRLKITSKFGSFNLKCISSPEDLQNHPTLHLLQPLLISGFVGLNATEERKFPKAIQDRVQTGRMSEIIRNLVLDIKEQPGGKTYKQLSSILDRYFNFHIDAIKFDKERDLHIITSFSEIREKQRISLDLISSGSGLLQVLQILAPIYRFASAGTIVLLDEPDAHLHTNLQYTLGQALREIQNELDIQIIISTHSIPMIEAAEPSEVVPVYAQTQHLEPLVDRSNVDEAISDLIDNYHLAKVKISRKLAFIEDSNTHILERFDEVLETKCFRGINTIPIIPGKGRDNKAPFLAKDMLKKYVGKDIQIHFVIDGDGMNEHWRKIIADYALNNGLILHQLTKHDIESYLLNPELFLRTLQEVHPGKELPSLQDIETNMLQIMKNTISLSKYGFDRKLEGHIYKSAMLVGLDEYRNPHKSESEAIKIREAYEKFSEFDQFVEVSIGKKALKAVLNWLCSEKKLNISQNDLLRYIKPNDIPEEIKSILEEMHSEI